MRFLPYAIVMALMWLFVHGGPTLACESRHTGMSLFEIPFSLWVPLCFLVLVWGVGKLRQKGEP